MHSLTKRLLFISFLSLFLFSFTSAACIKDYSNGVYTVNCSSTGMIANQGSNIWKVWVRDSAGNINYSTVSFNLDGGTSSCLMLDVCGNGIDDNCDSSIDEPSCVSIHQRFGSGLAWAIAPRYDSVQFGANHWDGSLGPDPANSKFLMPRDNSFGEHNGTTNMDLNNWKMRIEDAFGCEGSCLVQFDLAAQPGYNVLFSDMSWANPAATVSYSFDRINYQTISPDSTTYTINGYLINVPSNATSVRVRISNYNYYAGAGIAKVKTKYPFVNLTSQYKPNLVYDNYTIMRNNVLNEPVLQSYVGRLTGGWGSADTNYDVPTSYGCYVLNSRAYSQTVNMLAMACLIDGSSIYCTEGVSALIGFAGMNDSIGWGRFEYGGDDPCGAPRSILGTSEMLFGTSLAYDLLYNYMTPVQREYVLNKIDREANYLYHRATNQDAWEAERWWHYSPVTNNWGGVGGAGLGMAGLVLQGYSPYADVYLQKGTELTLWHLDKLSPYYHHNNQSAQSLDRADGVKFESIMYTEYPNKYVLSYLDTLKRKKGIDLLNYGNGKLNNSATHWLYSLAPQGINFVSFDDYYNNPDEGDPITSSTLIQTAKFFNNGLALYAWDTRSGLKKNSDWTYVIGGSALDLPFTLLYYPHGLTEVTPVQAKLPLGKLFQYGNVFSRTGWGKNDSYLALESGIGGAHSHYDQGSFFYGAHGNILLVEGSNPPTSEHSLILIDGQGQGHTELESTELGSVSFLHSMQYDYIGADNTVAYNVVTPMNYSSRDMIFRRGQNQYLVLFDSIRALSGTRTYESRIYPDENHRTITTLASNRYRFVGNRQVLSSGKIRNGARADVDLEVFLSSPTSPTISTGTPFSMTTSSSTGANFGLLFYPNSSSIIVPAIAPINPASDITGFTIGSDIVLYNPNYVLYNHNGINSNSRLSFVGNEVLGFSDGKYVSYAGKSINSTITTNAVWEFNSTTTNLYVGDESSNVTSPTRTITLTGLANRQYAYSLDGVNQGNVIVSNNIFNVNLNGLNHKITLI
jgi:hypothetical protein